MPHRVFVALSLTLVATSAAADTRYLAFDASDRVTRACADLLLEPSPTRDRLVANVYVGGADEAVGQLIDAFEQVVATQPIHDRLRDQKVRDWKTAVGCGLITAAEVAQLEAADRAVAAVIEVDDFAPTALAAHEQLPVPPAETPPLHSSPSAPLASVAGSAPIFPR